MIVSVCPQVGAEESDVAAALFGQPRPPPPAATQRSGTQRSAAAAALVLLLSRRALGDAWVLPRRVWKERYAALANESALPVQEPMDCDELRRVVAAGEGTGSTCLADDWAARIGREAKERFADVTRATWLANLAEVVAAERVSVRGAARFWRDLHACAPAADL